MKRILYSSLIASVMTFLSCKTNDPGAGSNDFPDIPLAYGTFAKDSVKDDYFGNEVPDPYRWLEDDNSSETKDWVLAQNKLTFDYLGHIPFRQALKTRITDLMNYEKQGAPFKEANSYFFFRNDGLQNQDVLFRKAGPEKPANLVLDPNAFSKEGTSSVSGITISKDGRYLAFQLSEAGSDWNKILVKDLNNGNFLNDTLEWIKFSNISWHKNGFYYSRYPEPKGQTALSGKNENHAVYYHRIGTPQKDDQLIYEDKKHPLRNVGATITQDEQYLILSISESTSGNALAIKDLTTEQNNWTWLVTEFDQDYSIIGNEGSQIFVHTNAGAANWKVVSIDMLKYSPKSWQDVLMEGEDVLQLVYLLNHKLVTVYMHNASSEIKIFDLHGNLQKNIQLPELGTVEMFSGKQDDSEAFYSFVSYIRPTSIFRLDLNSFEVEKYFEPKLNFDPDLYTTEQVWYNSKDGTKIPMFLTHRKGLQKDGQAPTLLYGYGGFDISYLPTFAERRIPILECGGIFAVANIRGGGEFGKKWHEAGTKERKQNVFDDFIAAADYLVSEKYTSRDKLAIEGRSNGGLLVGACITQRPDLCKVAFPIVGVLDMLRYHKFTIGWAWATDYGTSDTEEGFNYLKKYSPVHNCRPAEYPSTMITTADHDDRVVPAHSFKFASALQTAQQGKNPVLIRVDVAAGHGAGKPTGKKIDEIADMLSFMFYNMKVNPVVHLPKN